MSETRHITETQLLLHLDNELNAAEARQVDDHLESCFECAARRSALRELSDEIGKAVAAHPINISAGARRRLMVKMNQRRVPRWNTRFAAATAAAAVLIFTLSVLVAFRLHHWPLLQDHSYSGRGFGEGGSTRAPGERPFARLPYSDSSIPIQGTNIVRVEMRLSALAEAGITQTVSPPGKDRWVEADLLLGLDGEPIGIRLVSVPGEQ